MLACVVIAGSAKAQEYKVAKNSGRLEIKEVNQVTIEGHNGNEIVFTSTNRERERDARSPSPRPGRKV